MSWALNYPDGVRGDEHTMEDLDAKTLAEGMDYGDSSEEVLEQVRQAKIMANHIIQSHSVGDSDDYYYVNLSGHANPNHEPKEGWVNDCITVSISQK